MIKKHRPLRENFMLVGSVCALLVALMVWASLFEIIQTARAQGQVIAIARTQVIQAAIDGVIQEVSVQEGQTVKKGQVLVRMDDKQVEAGLKESQSKVAALQAALIRLRTEVLDRPLSFPKSLNSYPQFVNNQVELYERRKEALDADLASLAKNLQLVNKELTLNRGLLKTGDVGQADIIRLERQAAEISGQLQARKNKFFQDAQTDMTKAEEDLSTQESILSDRTATYERAIIYAPTDGLVKNIQITTAGARVRPGDIILELVPTSGEFVVEAKLKPADIAVIRSGLPCQIKLDAYDYSIYGSLKGTVKYISPDALTEKTPQGEATYYRVQIAIDYDGLTRHNADNPDLEIEIQPGMTGTVEIETGTHTVMSYLTKPITKTVNEALTER
ncbi:HlyD family efflux transporter periplasmic adaptor subunit [Aeromonas sanarellii]|uniref:HlyD family efflux transporter periplasmic adaptor subunit n=1 Tax=Aeromonas sanarellii TaxID=633415 RepID=UPI003B9F72DF